LRIFLSNHHLSRIGRAGSRQAARRGAISSGFQAQDRRRLQAAAELARKSLTSRDGVLVGRKSGRQMSKYLTSHTGLTPVGVRFFLNVLTRITRDVQHNRQFLRA